VNADEYVEADRWVGPDGSEYFTAPGEQPGQADPEALAEYVREAVAEQLGQYGPDDGEAVGPSGEQVYYDREQLDSLAQEQYGLPDWQAVEEHWAQQDDEAAEQAQVQEAADFFAGYSQSRIGLMAQKVLDETGAKIELPKLFSTTKGIWEDEQWQREHPGLGPEVSYEQAMRDAVDALSPSETELAQVEKYLLRKRISAEEPEAEQLAEENAGEDDGSDFVDEAEAQDAVRRAVEAGADFDKISAEAEALAEEGYDPAAAVEAAAYWHDHSEGDEMDAFEKISEREGWK
jgi:hypothetical protein